jgi:hypothetical protein
MQPVLGEKITQLPPQVCHVGLIDIHFVISFNTFLKNGTIHRSLRDLASARVCE